MQAAEAPEAALKSVVAWFFPVRQNTGYGTVYEFVFGTDIYTIKDNWISVGGSIFQRRGEYAILVQGVHKPEFRCYITKHKTYASFILHSPNSTHTTNDMHILAQYLNEMFGGPPIQPMPSHPMAYHPMPSHPMPYHPMPLHPMAYHSMPSQPSTFRSPMKFGGKEAVGLFAATAVAAAAAGGGVHVAKKMEPVARDLIKSAAARGANVDWKAAGDKAFAHPDARHAMNLVSALAQGNHGDAFIAGSRLTSPFQAAKLSAHLATGNHAAAAQTVANMLSNKMSQLKPIIAAASKPAPK